MIIVFSGLPQTGKTTLARRLADYLQCKFVSFGDYVRNEARKAGIVNPTRQDLQNLGQRLVETDAMLFCQGVLQTVEFSPGEHIVIDGVRHTQALHAISSLSTGQPIKLIYLCAPIEIRKARRAGDPDLAAVDAHKVESQTEHEIRELADLAINSSANLDVTFAHVVNWIQHQRQHVPPDPRRDY